tara:strand:+ start:334 stop:540 length:207 start_codon:yes stop_codon:yes gene_type:complete
MNKKAQLASNKFVRIMTDGCIVTNILLMGLSVTLSDGHLFKIAALSALLLILNRVYRHYEQKEEDKKQ